jgi:leucyl/phenylalanyl-tRNA--protein transferase
MLELFRLDHTNHFPALEFALEEPNGLLAFGGDLSTERLISAYRSGIFPWFSDGDPYLWWSPDPRGILKLEDFHLSKSLQKSIRKKHFRVTLNNHFKAVINECASVPRKVTGLGQVGETSELTWITDEMIAAYEQLHLAGHAHSIEVWEQQTLVGGLYGVAIGGMFCGESMFHLRTDASKVALFALVQHMRRHQLGFIDCQMGTAHLSSLGCKELSRENFISLLQTHRDTSVDSEVWRPQSITELLHTDIATAGRVASNMISSKAE